MNAGMDSLRRRTRAQLNQQAREAKTDAITRNLRARLHALAKADATDAAITIRLGKQLQESPHAEVRAIGNALEAEGVGILQRMPVVR